MSRAVEVELALDARAELGEGPIWDAERQRLLFVDIMGGQVHEFDPASHTDRVVEMGVPVGAVALGARGDWILAAIDGFYSADPATGQTRLLASVEADLAGNRMNDGYVDACGRFWAGTMSMEGVAERGTLYRLDADGSVHAMLSGVTTSNGIDWSLDSSIVYYIDTRTRRIDQFDFDLASGTIANRRPLVTIPAEEGSPDGLVVDAEGGVWVCLWRGGAVRRYTPDGRLDHVITVPATLTTKCAFGGADLGDLYITTATIELDDEERRQQPQAGGLFRCRPGVRGRPPNRCRVAIADSRLRDS